VASNRETTKAVFFHDRHHIPRHGPLRIWSMVLRGCRTTALAIAAEIRTNDRKPACQQWRYISPHQMGLREAVQKKDRWTRPKSADEDARLLDLNVCYVKVIQHSDARSS
jgi:hypothetical protein